MIESIKEVYDYKEALYYLTKKSLVSKYKRSILGFLWSLLDPILMMCVYTIVFSNILARNTPYFSIFLFAGLMPWRIFSISLNLGSSSIINYGYMISKIYFPRIIIPMSTVLVEVINYLYTIPVIVGMIIFFSDIKLTWNIVYLPYILFVEVILCMACAIFLSAVTVFFRDIKQILNIFTMMMFYLTAIVFPIDIMPNDISKWLKLNPMFHIIEAFRDIFYYAKSPDIRTITFIGVISVILLIISIMVFERLQGFFCEEV